MQGELHVIAGCMGSGKTELLYRYLTRRQLAGQDFIVFKHNLDTRAGSKEIGSRNGLTLPAISVENSLELLQILMEGFPFIQVVAIDEAQFFDYVLEHDIIEVIQDMGIDIFVTGLPQDFKGEPFGIMPRLMAKADKLDLLDAVCSQCGGRATKTQRLVEGKPAPSDSPVIQIGGLNDSTYEARCIDCHEVGDPIGTSEED